MVERDANKDLYELYGILLGVLCDEDVAPGELEILRAWRADRPDAEETPAARSIFPKIDAYLNEPAPTVEKAFQLWRDVETTLGGDDLSRASVAVRCLLGFVEGLLADAPLHSKEWRRLNGWLKSYSSSTGQNPAFDAVYANVKSVVDAQSDGSATDAELTARLTSAISSIK